MEASLRLGSGPGNWNWSRGKVVAGDFNYDGRTDLEVLYDYRSSTNPDTTGLLTFCSPPSGQP